MQPQKATPSPALVEQYRRQMLEMRPPAPPKTENWLDTRFPEPDFLRDREAIAISAATAPDETPEPSPETPFVGYLRVFVFTGEGAEPLEEARVTVSRDGVSYANVTTDRDGFTPVLPLPSVDPALTLTPGNLNPYTAYDITVNAAGYQGVRHQNMPVYGNNYVTLPTPLYPLLPGEDPDSMQDFQSGGPSNL